MVALVRMPRPLFEGLSGRVRHGACEPRFTGQVLPEDAEDTEARALGLGRWPVEFKACFRADAFLWFSPASFIILSSLRVELCRAKWCNVTSHVPRASCARGDSATGILKRFRRNDLQQVSFGAHAGVRFRGASSERSHPLRARLLLRCLRSQSSERLKFVFLIKFYTLREANTGERTDSIWESRGQRRADRLVVRQASV